MDGYGQRQLFREICDHLKERVTLGNLPDFVFLTGDLANKGLASEYLEFFDYFVGPMLDSLGPSFKGTLVAVPGNHDVERTRAPFFSREVVLSEPKNAFDPTREGQKTREQFALRFTNYSDRDVTSVSSRWIESEAGTFSFKEMIRGHSIGVVGVNTSWLCKDDNDRHRLTPGIELLAHGLSGVADADLKVVLGHHPLSWMQDDDEQRVRVILGKYSALYLHGHLHANEARYDDGGQGAFLGIRCGSAFQGRPGDKPTRINGLLWAEVNFDHKAISPEPFHWSSDHREWKLTTDAFPNSYEVDGKWTIDLPSAHKKPLLPSKEDKRAIDRASVWNEEGLPSGWAIVDEKFLLERSEEETQERLLQYFDGRPPTWRLAMSSGVPARNVVERVQKRFSQIVDVSRPTVVNLLGPGGEGKSTVFFQAIVRLIREGGWTALWRHSDVEQIDARVIRRLTYKYPKLLVAVDEAHSIAPNFSKLISHLGSTPLPHFLLCSRSIDWRAEVREMSPITLGSEYQEVDVRGIDKTDAEQIVCAWARLGRLGLGALAHVDPSVAADALLSASQNMEVEGDESALFGAMLQLRYGDKLKDRIRGVLYRLSDMHAPGRARIADAYAMIAAMHAEGLRFLSRPVLAEHFGMSSSDFQKNVIGPLADETIVGGGGRFVLCRHRAIAQASVAVLRETNLFGNVDSTYSDLSGAACAARQKGIFVPELHKWDYELPNHFMKTDRTLIAVAASEQMHAADPDDIHLRVNLSKIYRDSKQIEKAVRLFEDYIGKMSRAAWHEWAVSERWNGNQLDSIILAAISLCDLPGIAPAARDSVCMTTNTIAQNLLDLYRRYVDPIYLPTVVAAARIAAACSSNPDDRGAGTAQESLDAAREYGAPDVADTAGVYGQSGNRVSNAAGRFSNNFEGKN
jgi:Calcineurin-like phosphoesterase